MTETIPDPLWISPATPGDVAAALRRAADARQAIQIRGAGTKSHWGRAARPVDAVLDMRGLNRVLAHAHGDMTATVEAGASLHDVNLALSQHRQWLPLDPPFADRATIGGILATNDSGPLRHRYGTPRDLVIGIRLATTDGTLSKAGGQVVKNVAGYDLGKLMTGSFGAFAAIVSATFKLAPIPHASKTLRVDIASLGGIARTVTAVTTSQLEPLAFEIAIRNRRATMLVRFASLPAVVDAQVEQAQAALTGSATHLAILTAEVEQAAWREHVDAIWTGDSIVVRASWLPANIDAAIAELQACAVNLDVQLIGRAAIGAGLMRIAGPLDLQRRAIETLRASSAFGNVTVVRGPAALAVDVWPPDHGRARLFASLKQAFDPAHVLVGQGPL